MTLTTSLIKEFKFGLYLALVLKLFLPTVYQTFRVGLLGALPGSDQINIASQTVWVHVILLVLEESLVQPLYFCIGQSNTDTKSLRNKVKTGLLVFFAAYGIFSAVMVGLTDPLVKLMGQNETLHEATVAYIQVELGSVTLNGMTKFLSVVFVMQEWNLVIYALLTVQMVVSIFCDYTFASQSWANLGAMGIAYSSLCSSSIVLVLTCAMTCKKLEFDFTEDIKTARLDFSWLKDWTRIGLFAGLESFIRNSVYLVVILRSMNTLNEQGSYWVANTFIWNWLLLTVLPLNELIKQDVASCLDETSSGQKKLHRVKLLPYLIIGMTSVFVWAITYPAWPWFTVKILHADKPELVFDLLRILVPCYAFFVIVPILNGVFCALGRTDLMAFKSIGCNIIMGVLFITLTYSDAFYEFQAIYAVTAIFCITLVLGTFSTLILYCCYLSKKYPLI
jgi:Na+-driven multidrug efflux pump